MKLEFIPVPSWSPPEIGPWTICENHPDGRKVTYPKFSSLIWDDRVDAQHWADWASSQESAVTRGVTYDVILVTP